MTIAGEDGRFAFAPDVAGLYQLSASKEGYVTAHFGQRRQLEPTVAIAVPKEQAQGVAELILQSAGTIAGRLVDDLGRPIRGARVTGINAVRARLSSRRTPIGSTLVEPGTGAVRWEDAEPAATDESGDFTLSGLAAGEYYVVAWVAAQDNGPEDSARARGRLVYFPGASDPRSARTLSLASGGSVQAGFTAPSVLTVQISGTIQTTSGAPAHAATVRLFHQYGPEVPSLLRPPPRIGVVSADGTFVVSEVMPSEYYDLVAQVGTAWSEPGVQQDVELGRTRVTVRLDDLTGVVVRTTPGSTVTGRVSSADLDSSTTLGGMRVFSMPVDSRLADGNPLGSAAVREDGTFTLRNLFGRSLLLLDSPKRAPLHLQSVLVGGKDVRDAGLDARPATHLSGVSMIVSNHGIRVKGIVRDTTGRPAGQSIVVAFAHDERMRAHPSHRYTRVTRARADGSYTFSSLPVTKYMAIAIDHLPLEAAADPNVLRRLLKNARPIPAPTDGAVTVDLWLSRQPLRRRPSI